MRATLAAVALAAMLTASPAHADPVFPRGLPHALYEDGCASGVKRCVWDARHQGNGEGRSMILTRHRGDVLVKRISHRRAHRLQAAWCDRPTVDCRYAD